MKVTFLSIDDWANLGYNFAKAMRSVGVDAKAYANRKHVFRYPEQAEIISDLATIDDEIEASDAVVWMHSCGFNIPPHKSVWVFHGGTVYRYQYKQCNEFFNPMVKGTLIQDGVMLGRGAKNEHWVMPPVDIDMLKSRFITQAYSKEELLNVGHYPSCKEDLKGTPIITSAVRDLIEDGLPVRFLHNCGKIPWEQHLERVAQCHVYIDQLQPNIPMYGDWGISSLEAAAMGCIVMASFKSHYQYQHEFGRCPIIPVTSYMGIQRGITELLQCSLEELNSVVLDTTMWVKQFHSYEFVGNRLLDILMRGGNI